MISESSRLHFSMDTDLTLLLSLPVVMATAVGPISVGNTPAAFMVLITCLIAALLLSKAVRELVRRTRRSMREEQREGRENCH